MGQDHRVAERPLPSARYREGYPNNQHQQQQQSWPAERPMRRDNGANAAGLPPRYVDDGNSDPHASQQQWRGQRAQDEESSMWKRNGERGNNYPPNNRANAVAHQDYPPGHHPSSSSGWRDEAEGRGAPQSAYGSGGGQRQPPSRPMPRGAPRSAAGILPPHELRDNVDYGDEETGDIPLGKRRRPPPPGGRMLAPGRGASWNEDAVYSAPSSAGAAALTPAIRGEEFEKEVVRAAALLVAERELRAREEARNEVQLGQAWPDEPAARRYEDRNSRDKTHNANRSVDGTDGRRNKQRDSSGRSRTDDRGTWEGDTVGEDWRDGKRARREGDRANERAGTGRTNSRAKADTRDASYGKRAEDSRGRPATSGLREAERSRGRPQEDFQDRYRANDGEKYKDSRDPGTTSRTAKPTSKWDPPEVNAQEDGMNQWENNSIESGHFVHVGGVSFSTTFTALAKRFAAFGDVNGFKVVFNKVSCRTGANKAAVVTASTGFAFISFKDEAGMEKAVECMNNQMLDGHLLKVREGQEIDGF